MKPKRRSARWLVLAALLAGPLAWAGPAQADTQLPFTDPHAVGLIGFCDANNKPVTQGSIRDVPFVVRAVSDTPAGKAWAITGRKAALYATSPNRDLDPRLWSPYQMTPSTFYSNVKHPMAAAGYGEPPLEYHTTGSPPTLDNLVQLRMYLSAPNTTPYIDTYPTAVVRVQGDRWVMVAGDRTPDCGAGSAKNINQVLGKGEPTAPPTWAANVAAATKPAGGSGSASASATAPSSAEPSADADGAAAAAQAAASATSPSSPNVLPVAVGLLLGTAAIAVLVIALVARRRPASGTTGSRRHGG